MIWSTPRWRYAQVSSRSAVLAGITAKREVTAGVLAAMVVVDVERERGNERE
jgi:hypothetical protein